MKAVPILNKITNKWHIKIYYFLRPCNIILSRKNSQEAMTFASRELAEKFIDTRLNEYWKNLKNKI